MPLFGGKFNCQGISKMNGNKAVFFLADCTVVLALYAERFLSFFDDTGLVDDANGVFTGIAL